MKELQRFHQNWPVETINKDLSEYAAAWAKWNTRNWQKTGSNNGDINLLHKTYVRGLCEMYHPTPKAPDANFTIRLTYGNVKKHDRKTVYTTNITLHWKG